VVAFSACAETNDRELTLGTREGGVYTNEYFAFSFNYPQEFTVLNIAEVGRLLGLHVNRLGDHYTLAQLRMLPLLFAEYFPEPGADLMRSFTLSAERADDFRNETEYLQALLEPWRESEIVFYEGIITEAVRFDGRAFNRMEKRAEAQTVDGDRIVTGYHIFYVTRMHNYFVLFAFSDVNETVEEMRFWVSEVMGSFRGI